jgi:hypothetical protein
MYKHFFFGALASTVFLLSGCANNPLNSYKETSDQTLSKIYQGQTANAMKAKDTPDPLYNMEYGLLLRLNQQYEPSNLYFGRAQQSMDLWASSWASTTAGQTSTNLASLLLNDQVNGYQTKGYEKSFLATFYALNHLGLNNFNNARIEIKRLYELEQATQNYNALLYQKQEVASQNEKSNPTSRYLQKEILSKYDFSDINSPKVLALKNSYQNAFSHYLAGFVFEALHEPSLSRPGYVKAGQLNPTNKLIQQSIDNIDQGVSPKPDFTDLLIVEEVGHAPQIQSGQISFPINLNLVNKQYSCINMINIFYPKLILDNQNQALYPYMLDTRQLMPYPMVDVNLMAARTLHDEIPHLISRNIAAALRNIAATQVVCSQQNQTNGGLGSLLQFGIGIASATIDKSDERTLTLLPAKINMNRIHLPYGKHKLSITLNGVSYTQAMILNQPYQIMTFRIIGSQVLFDPQRSMVTS